MAGRPPRMRKVPLAAGGRPTICTPAVIEAFADAYSRGHGIERAAVLVGIHEDTVQSWWRKGADGTEPYATFVRESMRARMLASDDAAKRAHGLNPTWWLERVQHVDFGRKDRLDVTTGGVGLIEAVRQARALADGDGLGENDPDEVVLLPARKTNGIGGSETK